jgi:uncharacterized protein YbjT (DUF2867 family)
LFGREDVPVIVLVTGANGLIGSRCVQALRCAGHRVIAGVRHAPTGADDSVEIDYAQDIRVEAWIPRLEGVDAVINAVGIVREREGQTFETLHCRTPRALFAACVETGVKRIVQISALGADDGANTAFHSSKKMADDFLLARPISAVVVQPSLVFSTDGASTRLFARLATLPLLALPDGGRQRIQPVALDDLAEAIAKLVAAPTVPQRLPAVGATVMEFRSYLQLLRYRMGYGAAYIVSISTRSMRRLLRLPGIEQLADADALAMLERGNEADPKPFAKVLGRPPAGPREFIAGPAATTLRTDAGLQLWRAALRGAIALLWIMTGVFSLGLYPIDASLELLARTGLTGMPARLALVGAALLDILLGIATLFVRRQWLWTTQILLILGYTLIISIKLPEFWLHPYAPILKNIPLLAAIALMRNLERR